VLTKLITALTAQVGGAAGGKTDGKTGQTGGTTTPPTDSTGGSGAPPTPGTGTLPPNTIGTGPTAGGGAPAAEHKAGDPDPSDPTKHWVVMSNGQGMFM
jgi:hypothetical protein